VNEARKKLKVTSSFLPLNYRPLNSLGEKAWEAFARPCLFIFKENNDKVYSSCKETVQAYYNACSNNH